MYIIWPLRGRRTERVSAVVRVSFCSVIIREPCLRLKICIKVMVKINLFAYIIKHHDTKAYWGSAGIDPFINFGTG